MQIHFVLYLIPLKVHYVFRSENIGKVDFLHNFFFYATGHSFTVRHSFKPTHTILSVFHMFVCMYLCMFPWTCSTRKFRPFKGIIMMSIYTSLGSPYLLLGSLKQRDLIICSTFQYIS